MDIIRLHLSTSLHLSISSPQVREGPPSLCRDVGADRELREDGKRLMAGGKRKTQNTQAG
jgi:hypothetical protein